MVRALQIFANIAATCSLQAAFLMHITPCFLASSVCCMLPVSVTLGVSCTAGVDVDKLFLGSVWLMEAP